MCERMVTVPHAPRLVPRMWQAARARGIDAPDWTGTTPPGDRALPPDRYHALLAERATGVRLDLQEDRVRVAAPPGSVIRLWNGATTTLHIGDGEETTLLLPPGGPSDSSAGDSGAAVFTRATGWRRGGSGRMRRSVFDPGAGADAWVPHHRPGRSAGAIDRAGRWRNCLDSRQIPCRDDPFTAGDRW
ncbi:hypothetical protein [Streptomyces sp. NPDC059994]|uniref:hypothetical protein n=1 Tax=Streptomyces sp. NPDC059994 TaxID=3347029 RepID=UPI00369C587A